MLLLIKRVVMVLFVVVKIVCFVCAAGPCNIP